MFHVPFTFSFTEAQSAYLRKTKNIGSCIDKITLILLRKEAIGI